jgi:hypothetical protein
MEKKKKRPTVVCVGLRWPALAFVGLRWACTGCRWPSLACAGICWPALAFVGLRWACTGCCWPSLACVGLRWSALAFVGLHWACNGCRRPSLACAGLCWPVLAFVGSFSILIRMKEKKRLTVHHLIATPHRHKNWAVIVESGCCVVTVKTGGGSETGSMLWCQRQSCTMEERKAKHF